MRQTVQNRSVKQVFKGVLGIALLLLALGILGCGGSGGGGSPNHDKLTSICESATKGQFDCSCVADRVEASGYNNPASISQLQAIAKQAEDTGYPAALPQPVLTALDSCKASS
jgi:hypothetical protein